MSTNKRTKRLAALDAPPVLTGKRKRATVSYAEVEGDSDPASDDEAVKVAEVTATTDSDEDDDFSISRKKATKKAPLKKKVKKAAKPKGPKPFRFLDLPPELRDIIYEMALVEPNDVSIITQNKDLRKIPLRGPVYSERSLQHQHRLQGRTTLVQLAPPSTSFIPALLAVNKQINREAINYLYSHKFIFENFFALIQFVTVIGSRNQQRLETIRVVSWGSGRGASKLANHCGLAMLGGATNLKTLELHGAIETRSPVALAKQIFREGYHFIQAFGATKDSKDAAVDIISLSDEALDFSRYRRRGGPFTKEQDHQVFQRQLRTLAKTL